MVQHILGIGLILSNHVAQVRRHHGIDLIHAELRNSANAKSSGLNGVGSVLINRQMVGPGGVDRLHSLIEGVNEDRIVLIVVGVEASGHEGVGKLPTGGNAACLNQPRCDRSRDWVAKGTVAEIGVVRVCENSSPKFRHSETPFVNEVWLRAIALNRCLHTHKIVGDTLFPHSRCL